MTKVINGDFVLKKDTFLNENLIVTGSIVGKNHVPFSLFVEGSVDAKNIKVKYMKALNINANRIESEKIIAEKINANALEIWNVDSQSIDCYEIDSEYINSKNLCAHKINADFIVCDKFIPKNNDSKIMAKIFLENPNLIKRKEWSLTKEIIVK